MEWKKVSEEGAQRLTSEFLYIVEVASEKPGEMWLDAVFDSWLSM
jgi:hypothetical protein